MNRTDWQPSILSPAGFAGWVTLLYPNPIDLSVSVVLIRRFCVKKSLVN
jgi:hypothetical protein